MSLSRRVATSAVLMPLVVLFIFYAPAVLFAALISVVVLLACGEWFAMNERRLIEWLPAGVLAGSLPMGLHLGGDLFWGIWTSVSVLYLAVASLAASSSLEARLRFTEEKAFALFLVGAPLAFAAPLRSLPDGTRAVFFLLICLWLVDTGAYAAGCTFGRRPMAPVLSPKKTLEGLAGGLLAGAIGGGIAGPMLLHSPVAASALAGLLLGALGQLGDLFESLWKRALGRKDSGTLIPGHGGILDRIDSFLLTLPVFYHACRLLLTDR